MMMDQLNYVAQYRRNAAADSSPALHSEQEALATKVKAKANL